MVDWHLLPNEKPIHEAKISRRLPYFIKFHAVFLVLVIGAIYLIFSSFVLYFPNYLASIVLVLIGIGIEFWFVEKNRNKERILITTNRVLVRKTGGGVVSDLEKGKMEMEQMDLDKIVNISVKQANFVQRMLKIGDIIIRVPGGDHAIRSIDNPYAIERAIYRILEKEKKS